MNLIFTVIVLVLALFFLGVKIIRPVQVGIIEFLGRYQRTASAGFNWIMPFFSKIYRINITERRVDIDPQSIITKDKLNAVVDGVVYYRVEDAQKADETFTKLMGDEVAPRKRFIQTRAKEAELDI